MNNLKEIRERKQISQQELADKTGVERSTVAKWETVGFPRAEKLPAIAKVLECSVDDLLDVKK